MNAAMKAMERMLVIRNIWMMKKKRIKIKISQNDATSDGREKEADKDDEVSGKEET